ncbi:LysR family transcriptional regulator [Lactococcus petauri]|uniref:LysR family transcriptional regulator n=1 Tax=Lactococcus petauri TaxID=1940789 RepID=UPI001F5AF9DF|nr:LysR family transcriptional regulator [Lactococcus petauri]
MFDLLETFVVAYETKNFTSAAEHLFVTQSIVTKRLKKLEEQLNIVLFSRENAKQVTPTAAGEKFYPIALNFIDNWKNVQNNFKNQSKKIPFTIGMTKSSSMFILPNFIKLLENELSMFDFKIHIHDSKTLLSLIETRAIDVAIVNQNFFNPNIEKIPLFKDELVLAGNNNSTLFIKEAESQIEYLSKKAFKKSAIPFEKKVYVNDYGVIINLIKKNLGTAFLPQKLVPQHVSFRTFDCDTSFQYILIYHCEESNPIIEKIKRNIEDLSGNLKSNY